MDLSDVKLSSPEHSDQEEMEFEDAPDTAKTPIVSTPTTDRSRSLVSTSRFALKDRQASASPSVRSLTDRRDSFSSASAATPISSVHAMVDPSSAAEAATATATATPAATDEPPSSSADETPRVSTDARDAPQEQAPASAKNEGLAIDITSSSTATSPAPATGVAAATTTQLQDLEEKENNPSDAETTTSPNNPPPSSRAARPESLIFDDVQLEDPKDVPEPESIAQTPAVQSKGQESMQQQQPSQEQPQQQQQPQSSTAAIASTPALATPAATPLPTISEKTAQSAVATPAPAPSTDRVESPSTSTATLSQASAPAATAQAESPVEQARGRSITTHLVDADASSSRPDRSQSRSSGFLQQFPFRSSSSSNANTNAAAAKDTASSNDTGNTGNDNDKKPPAAAPPAPTRKLNNPFSWLARKKSVQPQTSSPPPPANNGSANPAQASATTNTAAAAANAPTGSSSAPGSQQGSRKNSNAIAAGGSSPDFMLSRLDEDRVFDERLSAKEVLKERFKLLRMKEEAGITLDSLDGEPHANSNNNGDRKSQSRGSSAASSSGEDSDPTPPAGGSSAADVSVGGEQQEAATGLGIGVHHLHPPKNVLEEEDGSLDSPFPPPLKKKPAMPERNSAAPPSSENASSSSSAVNATASKTRSSSVASSSFDPNLAPGTVVGMQAGPSAMQDPEAPVDWDLWQAVVYEGPAAVAKTSAAELNRAIAAGIPSAIRGVVWQVLAQSKNEDLESVYRELVARGTDKEVPPAHSQPHQQHQHQNQQQNQATSPVPTSAPHSANSLKDSVTSSSVSTTTSSSPKSATASGQSTPATTNGMTSPVDKTTTGTGVSAAATTTTAASQQDGGTRMSRTHSQASTTGGSTVAAVAGLSAEEAAKVQAAMNAERAKKAREELAALKKLEKAIRKDLGGRSNYSKYAAAAGLQDALFNVCKAYALFDEAVGYAQGMNFIVMPLLFNMPEEEAFCLLVKLMNQYRLRDLFTEGMPGLHLHLYQFERLLEDVEPALCYHLHKRGVVPSLYATQWFMTLFAYRFPLQLVLRVYDLILSEGLEGAVLKFGIALMLKNADNLLALTDMNALKTYLNERVFDAYIDHAPSQTSILESGFFGSSSAPGDRDVYRADQLVRDACAVRATPELLRQYTADYEARLRMEREREAEFDNLRSANASLALKIRALEQRAEKSDADHVHMASEMIRCKVENEELRAGKRELQRDIQALREVIARQPAEVETRLKDEMDRIMSRNIEVQNENRALEESMVEMERDLVETKMRFAEINSDHEALKQRWADLRRALGD